MQWLPTFLQRRDHYYTGCFKKVRHFGGDSLCIEAISANFHKFGAIPDAKDRLKRSGKGSESS